MVLPVQRYRCRGSPPPRGLSIFVSGIFSPPPPLYSFLCFEFPQAPTSPPRSIISSSLTSAIDRRQPWRQVRSLSPPASGGHTPVSVDFSAEQPDILCNHSQRHHIGNLVLYCLFSLSFFATPAASSQGAPPPPGHVHGWPLLSPFYAAPLHHCQAVLLAVFSFRVFSFF